MCLGHSVCLGVAKVLLLYEVSFMFCVVARAFSKQLADYKFCRSRQ